MPIEQVIKDIEEYKRLIIKDTNRADDLGILIANITDQNYNKTNKFYWDLKNHN